MYCNKRVFIIIILHDDLFERLGVDNVCALIENRNKCLS